MPDLIRGDDWVGPVHHLPGQPFGGGPRECATIVGLLQRQARAQPQAPFLTTHGEGLPRETISYGRAYQEVRRRAALLRRWGLQQGDRAGVSGQNSAHFVYAVLAVLEAGGVAVLLSHHDPPPRTAAHAAFTEARFLLHDPDSAAGAAAYAGAERTCSFEQFEREAAATPDVGGATGAALKPTDGALILFTSGTTGAAKAVVQSHYNVAWHAHTVAAHHRIEPGVRLLCVLPLHHVNGLEFTIFSVLAGGGHTVLSRGFDGLRFWNIVREQEIHIASLVPNLLRLLAERPRPRGSEALPLRYAVSAAAPLSTAIAARVWEQLGLRIVQGYGLSEATNFSCLMPRDPGEEAYRRCMIDGRRTAIGPALPGQQVEVHDEHGPAEPGKEGEILIRGRCVMSGYLHNDAATAESFRGGWFHTGDLGFALPGEQGRPFIHVSGRLREIAKRSGAMVSLLELDETLMAIPGVADAGSAAFANSWVDEEIAALVVKEPGSALDEATITAHCRRSLPFAALPKSIEFVEEIPRTASGKIRRVEIAQRFAGLRERLFVERRTE